MTEIPPEPQRECRTCFRWRPAGEFALRVSDRMSQHVGLCRSCRVKLWDDPDDAAEIHPAAWRGPQLSGQEGNGDDRTGATRRGPRHPAGALMSGKPCGMVGILQDPDGRDYNTHCDQPGTVEVDGVLMCQGCADRVKGGLP